MDVNHRKNICVIINLAESIVSRKTREYTEAGIMRWVRILGLRFSRL